MSDPGAEEAGLSASAEEVVLLPADIPGAELSEPLEKHQVAALRWWLLCRGIKVSTSVRKKDLVERLANELVLLTQGLLNFLCYRVKKVNEDGAEIVDVDGSYVYRKFKSLADAGKNVSLPTTPPLPMSGWITMSSENYQALSSSIPPVTHGKYILMGQSQDIAEL